MPTLTISRKPLIWYACTRKLKVVLNDEVIGKISPGKAASFENPSGDHVVQVKVGGSSSALFSLDAKDEAVTLRVTSPWQGTDHLYLTGIGLFMKWRNMRGEGTKALALEPVEMGHL